MNDTPPPLGSLLVHAAWLRRLGFALLRDADAAEDVAQHTLVTAWQRPPTADRAVRPWLAEVARNRAEDHRRSEARRAARERTALMGAPNQAPDAEALLVELELHRTVAEVLAALEEPFRETLMLRYYEGLPAVEVAARLRVPAGTVRWRVKEGLARVRQRLDERHGGQRERWALGLAPLVPAGRPTGSSRGARRLPIADLVVAALAGLAALAPIQRPTSAAHERTIESFAAKRGIETHPAYATRITEAKPPTLVLSETAASALTPTDPDELLKQMLDAIAGGSYDDFLLHAADEMKAAAHRDRFATLAPAGARLRLGWSAEALGVLESESARTHVWKIILRDGDEDLLVRLALHDGRFIGFTIN